MSTQAADITAAPSVERILQVAEALFAEHGYDGTSMNAIAAQAEVSKANIFHHFQSKEALYLAVVKNACGQSETALDELVSTAANFKERLQHFADAHLANILDRASTSRLVLRQVLEGATERNKALAEQVIDEHFSRIVAMVRDGQKRGEVRADVDPAMVATILVGADVFFFLASPVQRHLSDVKFADDPQNYSRMLVDILLHGVAAKRRATGL